ncbi:MAG TPA: archaetidylserine decarboxylase [Gammaproteobacteria bacterium]|nr:archaetidylserine decarboxylase [Gammaproteobacteria bacterium]
MSAPFAVRVQHLLPQRLLCAFIYRVSRCRIRWFKAALIGWFARHYRVDLDEAEDSRLSAYPSFNAFFTRALRPGARRIAGGEETLVSPADGQLTQVGAIRHGQLVQAKGFDYSLGELLGETPSAIAAFDGGISATIYLAPHNYHRVHVPAAGRLLAMRYIAGRRYSVNSTTASWIDALYCRNERLVCWLESPAGRYAVVLVGALNVSSISTVLTGEIRSGTDQHWPHPPAREFARGAELARFNLGSTVVLALPRGFAAIAADVAAGRSIEMGERLAVIDGPATGSAT